MTEKARVSGASDSIGDGYRVAIDNDRDAFYCEAPRKEGGLARHYPFYITGYENLKKIARLFQVCGFYDSTAKVDASGLFQGAVKGDEGGEA